MVSGSTSSESGSTVPSSQVTDLNVAMSNLDLSKKQRKELDQHMAFLPEPGMEHQGAAKSGRKEELLMTPLFSGPVLTVARENFPQYGLLGKNLSMPNGNANQGWDDDSNESTKNDPRILLNVSTPWSAFICGSQGSGKSHTLSCMLENCLIPSNLGKLAHPLTGLVFHFDKYTSYGNSQVCEAAYLCSSGIPVRVLVSPTNFWRMKLAYESLPGLRPGAKKPVVIPMLFQDRQLDIRKMMKMMAVTDKEGPAPLYVEVIMRILREMAIESKGAPGLNYRALRQRLSYEDFSPGQMGPLQLRLDMLESFMHPGAAPGSDAAQAQADKIVPLANTRAGYGAARQRAKNAERERAAAANNRTTLASDTNATDAWHFPAGSLTIVDLSCPFVEEALACTLFGIALDLFLEDRGPEAGRVVALDEAHKFMTGTAAADGFTESLLQVVRLQRHLATRVIVATQEPTVSPKLLDLATMTIVHRFTSPEWMKALRGHLAGVSAVGVATEDGEKGEERARRDVARLFAKIVALDAGEALLFSPAAMLDLTAAAGGEDGANNLEPKKLGSKHVKVRVRKRFTADGGRSIPAV